MLPFPRTYKIIPFFSLDFPRLALGNITTHEIAAIADHQVGDRFHKHYSIRNLQGFTTWMIDTLAPERPISSVVYDII